MQRFGKRHDNIIRDIENLKCSKGFASLNFEECSYDDRGRKLPMYEMTRDGWVFLVMGFGRSTFGLAGSPVSVRIHSAEF